ncbi:unnamed protein product [Callosobruchus maculatus]|uniref:Uncharacterized protein n=1 Tax=Callosobruchus maculatus TaxID=64391 RepID=A0A653CNJ6_CALMS|nr:unnamed protein product [Callosobruchus maculatus]
MSNILDAENIKHVNLPPNKIISHHPAQLSSPHCSENTKKTTSNEVEGANSTKPVQSKKLSDIPLHLSDDGYTNMQKHSEEQEDGKVSNRNGDYTCCKCTKCDCCQFCKGEFFEKDTFAKFKEAKKHNQDCQAYGERIRDKFISDTDDLYTSRQCHTSKPNQGSGKKYKGAKSQTFINADRNSDSLEELRQSKENRPCDTDIYKINISRTGKNIPLKHVKTCSLDGKPLAISNVKSPSFPPQKFMGNDDGETVAQIDKNYESGTTSTLMIECPDMTCCISNRRMYCSTSK